MRDPLRLPPVQPLPETGAPAEAPRDAVTGPCDPAAGPRDAVTGPRDVADPRDLTARRFHPVAPFGRPSESQRAASLRLVDAIGLHLVCPEPRCRRAKRCRDPDRAQLPLCVWLHRGTCRFVLACLAGRAEGGEPEDERAPQRSSWIGPDGDTLLGGLRRAGWPIERFARTREDGADEWSWEAEPEACALVKAFRRPTTGRP